MLKIYEIPTTVLTTKDELLYLQMLYVSNQTVYNGFLQNGYTVEECVNNPDVLYLMKNVSVLAPNTPIKGIIDNRPAPEVLRDKGFMHVVTFTPGQYHWIINGQKFLATVTLITDTSFGHIDAITVELEYLSGSYATLHPDYVGKKYSPFKPPYAGSLAAMVTAVEDGGMMCNPTPYIDIRVDTGTPPKVAPYFTNWHDQYNGGANEKIYRELLFNIPVNQQGDVDLGKTYDEFDSNYVGPTSKPQGIPDNPDIGDFDTTSEPIPPPDIDELNKYSAVNTGLISVYNPSIDEVTNLANFLWSDLFSLDTFKKMFGSPMEAILSLHVIPIQPTSYVDKQKVIIGNVNTDVTMYKVVQQFVSFNCGAVNIQSFFGSALDFSPFTKMSIFLPYIGIRELDVDEIMYKTVGVQYLFDVLTGACNALVTVDGDVRYQFSGSASLQMPINATNWSSVINNIMSLATATIATVASSGAAAGQLLTAGANAVTSSKMSIERSGAVTGAAGFLGVQTPYLIRTIPRQSLAQNYRSFCGYPANITAKLNDLSGYTEVEQIFLDGVTATDAEKDEIITLLKNGVII